MGAIKEILALVRVVIRISGGREERAAGWLAAIEETTREARVSIEAADESRRRFQERYGPCGDALRRR
jgi:hypothetical protein